MKTRIITLLLCLVSLSVMGQSTVTRKKKTETKTEQKQTTVPKKNTGQKPAQKTPAEAAGYDVTFTCNASSATLYIDGTSYGAVAGTRFLKTGTHSIKLTYGGYDDYQTDITVNRANTSFAFNMTKQTIPEKIVVPKDDFNLKEYLKAPMGISAISFDKNPTYNEVMKVLGKVYTMYDSDNSSYLHASFFAHRNKDLELPSYHGIPFYYFSMLYELDGITRGSVFYTFETQGSKPSLSEMYRKLDLIVRDFQAIGIPMEYTKKNEEYTKAKGEIVVNNVKYCLELNDYGTYQIEIRIFPH